MVRSGRRVRYDAILSPKPWSTTLLFSNHEMDQLCEHGVRGVARLLLNSSDRILSGVTNSKPCPIPSVRALTSCRSSYK
jgi:hypothetical protein